jgi:nitrogen fixation/metabolism regulation signal transduction histidine kinase
MASFKRKQYVIDKKFQYNISFKAVALPLVTVLIVGFVLLFFAVRNNNYINTIVKTQGDMIEMFLTTPALVNSANPTIKNAKSTFDNNIGMLQEIKRNSEIVMYFIIAMIVVQSIIIFAIFIFLTHRISGPIWVMSRYLREIQQGNKPSNRPLRKNDELQSFYSELQATVEMLLEKKKK